MDYLLSTEILSRYQMLGVKMLFLKGGVSGLPKMPGLKAAVLAVPTPNLSLSKMILREWSFLIRLLITLKYRLN